MNLSLNEKYKKAIACVTDENYAGAIGLFDEILMIEPSYIDALLNKGVCLGRQRKYIEAIKCFDDALKIEPNSVEARRYRELSIRKAEGIEEKQEGDDTPLHRAVSGGNKEEIARLASGGADVNEKGKSGWTPLHLAVQNGKTDIIDLLLSSGADINRRDKSGASPIFYAIMIEDLKLVDYLKSRGADLTIKNTMGQNPLHFAITVWVTWKDREKVLRQRENKIKMVELLLAGGVGVNVENNLGVTPYEEALAANFKEICPLLKKYGAKPRYEAEDMEGQEKLSGEILEMLGKQGYGNGPFRKATPERGGCMVMVIMTIIIIIILLL